jgi:hypothetical protein
MDKKLARCGVYCGQCRSFHGDTANLAKQLQNLINTDLSWIEDAWPKAQNPLNYTEFMRGLAWMTEQQCPGCRNVDESWCDVKKCDKIQKDSIDNCLVCEEMPECKFTEYQRSRYSYLLRDWESVQETGIDSYCKEQEKREEQGIRIQDIRDW